MVLVLSQLDHRYFRGLQGQYNFRLQFRLHEEGKTGAEEYIVRSHGNYLMERSVSIELPSLSPGNYLVYISIIGERNTQLPSTEDVVKRECESREENEKLSQVGQAYDLAHSKAASHLDKLSKDREKADAKKASEARKKERRKNWEKRQIRRRIAQKQKDKDDAKKVEGKRCKKAKAEAEAREAAQKEAEARSTQAQLQPADKSIQTDTNQRNDEGSQIGIDADNASTVSSLSSSTSTPQYTPQDTPRNPLPEPAEDVKEMVGTPPTQNTAISAISGGPPPIPATAPTSSPSIQIDAQKSLELRLHYCSCSSCKPPPKVEESDEYSSDSPVEDHEQLYDEDDANAALRLAGSPAAASTKNEDSDDEDTPEPWNAIAVVGFRVYSKDESLELRVLMEGGELEQDGMGNLGEADLDNAVTNAAGHREKKQDVKPGEGRDQYESTKKKSSEQVADKQVTGPDVGGNSEETVMIGQEMESTALLAGKAAYRTIIERQTSEFDRVMGKLKADRANAGNPAENAMVKDTTPTTPQPLTEEPNKTERSADQNNEGASMLPAHTNLGAPVMQVGDITKAVLLIRSKLQNVCRNMLVRKQEPRKDDMQEMSNYLAQLESFPDLEASIIQSTKIHKVMVAILKLERLPKDDGFKFSIESRAQALLDDYELTLMTTEDPAKAILEG